MLFIIVEVSTYHAIADAVSVGIVGRRLAGGIALADIVRDIGHIDILTDR